MPECMELRERIGRLLSRAPYATDDARLLSEMEDVLSQGYVEALSAEARSSRLRHRMEDLVERLDEADAAVEVRRLAVQRRALDQHARDLREQLAIMREHFIRLGGGRSAPR